MKRLILFMLMFSLTLPVNGFCEDNIQSEVPVKSKDESSSAGLWIGAGLGCILGGVINLNSANSYKDKNSDPRKYDQEDVKSTVDTMKAVSYIGIGLGAAFVIAGVSKLNVSKTTEVSINTEGKTPIIVAKYSF